MTGDKVDKATMTYGNRDDMWVANKVRMLMRDDLDHEFVCVGGRDRIMYLSQEVERLTSLYDGHRREAERLKKKQEQITKDADAGMVKDLAIIWNSTDEKESLQSALTRARAEGMEEAAQIAECTELPNSMHAELMMRNKIATSIRARATKGDSDEG